MASNRIIAGIDIGTHTTRVIVCSVSEQQKEPLILGVGSAPTKGLHHGYVINRYDAVKSVRTALAAAQKDANTSIKTAYLAMGGISLSSETVATTITIENNTHEVTRREVHNATEACEDILMSRSNNIKVLHAIPLKYKIGGENVLGSPLGLKGKNLSVKTLFVTCLEHHFEELVSVVHEAGVDVIDVVGAPLAASLATLDHAHRMAGCALVDIGAETVSIAVFEDNKLLSLEVFPIGSTDITNDIALGFQVSLDEAETMKRSVKESESGRLTSAQERLDEIVTARLSDIFELVDKHLKNIRRSHLLPAGIIVTGGGSLLGHVTDLARTLLQLPVHVPRQISSSAGKRKIRDASWYVAYGLCFLVGSEFSASYKGPSALKQLGRQIKDSFGKLFKQLVP